MIKCTKCKTVFLTRFQLKKFVEVQVAADDVYDIPYNDFDNFVLEAGPMDGYVFRGCPNCETDAYLQKASLFEYRLYRKERNA